MKYFYLDREQAKKGVALVYMVSEEKIENYVEYFEDRAVEFYGEDVPHYITYISGKDEIREATEEEKLSKGQRALENYEVLIDGKIVTYDNTVKKVVNGDILDKTRDDYISEGTITVESEKIKARGTRRMLFTAMDIYEKNILCGKEEKDEDKKTELDSWYQSWLDVPNNYDDLKIPIEDSFPATPGFIEYYL